MEGNERKEFNFRDIEKKWQYRWGAEFYKPKCKGKKYMITFPIPYLNGSPHLGHAYTLFRVDVLARFKRMQGFDVLFAQGFHATGEPLLGAIERLRKGDPVQISTFKESGVSEQDMERFKEDPLYAAQFWKNRWIVDLQNAGVSIDWSRTFMTATAHYNKFIEWQYLTLKKKGMIVKGTHPVVWCPHDQSPTGDHDRLEGEGAYPVQHTLIKFQAEFLSERAEGIPVYLMASTLRPETLYGATNLWIDENYEYVMVAVDREIWIVSQIAYEKLMDQNKDVKTIGKIHGAELLGNKVVNPVTNFGVPILPAKFIDMDKGTGIVMSVPAHAPYDWMAIKELFSKSEELERFGLTQNDLQPIKVINFEGSGDNPAAEVCDKLGITSLAQGDLLEKATKELYAKEFHQGTILINYGKYGGMSVEKSKDKLIVDFIKGNIADSLWEISEKVVCRCTTVCHVKILKDQWFLKYSDKKWKAAAKKHILSMTVLPEEARNNLLATIDWLEDKACARKSGLGTKLPWDNEWIVETLSDSTIYNALYTIYNIINESKIAPEQLTSEVFDFVFCGKKSASLKKSKIKSALLKKMQSEFVRWYPVDMRISGKDLIQNHFAFYVLHHIALFNKKYWPLGIGVNGHIQVEGEKMSKSKGNILVLRNLVEEHGSDLVRITAVSSGEGLEDANWSARDLQSYRSRIEFLLELAEKIKTLKSSPKRNQDAWLLSELQTIIKESTMNYEKLVLRSASSLSLFRAYNAIKWYIRRCGSLENANKTTLEKFLSDIIKLNAPLAPHVMEEAWHLMGNRSFISQEKMPVYDKKCVNPSSEKAEEFLRAILKDVDHVKRIVAKKMPHPKAVSIFVAKSATFKDKKEKAMQLSILNEALLFLEQELSMKVSVVDSDNSTDTKADKATSERPGLVIE